MGSSLHPFVLIVAFATVAAIGTFLFAVRSRRVVVKALFYALTMLLLVPGIYTLRGLYPELFDRRYATFKKFYTAIELRMPRDEVFATMHRMYPDRAGRQEPILMESTTDSVWLLMNHEGQHDTGCEGISLVIESDRVVKKQYIAD